MRSWTDKYSADIAEQLKVYVDRNMPHYDYMSRFKV